MPEKFRFDKYFFFPLTIFLVSVTAIAFLGLVYYADQKTAIKNEKQAELMAIADLKANQIEKWYMDQLMDTNIEINNPFTVAAVSKWMGKDNSPELNRDVIDFLVSVKNANDFDGVTLLDSTGNVRMSSYDQPALPDDYEKRFIAVAVSRNKAVFSDLHTSGASGQVHIDVFIPLVTKQRNVAGVIWLLIDPNRYLYPLIQSWPAHSLTAETLLVRRDGDKVIFLNELRHRKGTALNLRLPLNQQALPAALAAAGKTGVMEGTDYRGIEVVAAVRQIHGLPWAMVSKIDRDEIYAPIRRRLWTVSIVVMLLTVAAGTGIGLFWYKQSTDYYERQYASEKKFKDVMSSLAEGIHVINEKGHLAYANLEAERILGWTSKELSGRIIHDLIHSCDKDGNPLHLKACPIHRVFETGERYFSQQEVFIRKDGSSFPVSVLASPVIKDGKIVASVVSFRDITAQKQLELALNRISRQNELILNSTGEGILGLDLEGRIIFTNPATAKMSEFRAEELIGRNMHDLLHHTKDDGMPYPREECPIYAAFKEGKTYHNDSEVFWRKDRSSFPVDYTSTPIRDEQGELIGAVVIYQDITERRQAEKAVFQLAAIVESSDDAIIGKTLDGTITSWNSGAETLYGYTKDEVIGRSVSLLVPSGYSDETPLLLEQIGKGMRVDHYETLRMKKDGSLIDVSLIISPIKDSNGKITGASAIDRDITDRKKAEELLRNISITDSLTGLANRRAFDAFLDEEWRRAMRDNRRLTMMMIDVDFFKKYNDTYGHLDGDECLKQVANVLKHFARRPGDLAARFGGEEFVVVFSMIAPGETIRYAEKIRSGIESLKIVHEQSEICGYVTVSIGVASLIPQQNMSPVDFIKCADEALYKAKKEGRNRAAFTEGHPQ